jgi:photosystem II stability/assembly factor-like uncharacterized protein
MLGRNYRFSVNNGTTAAVEIGVTIQARLWKFGTDGSLTFSSETEVFNELNIAVSATAWTEDTAVDNSTDKYIGADLEIVITPEASITGLVSIQIQKSTDGGTTWPDDGLGIPVAAHYFSASASAVTLNAEI